MAAPGRPSPLAERLRGAWQHRGALALALWPMSLLYGMLTALRRALYRTGLLRSERLPVPVIVVGNVIAGGAGKTPVTLAVVRHLQARGWRPGVIARGYGRATADCREVLPASSAAEVGDEPLLIARASGAPVFVARRRAQAGRALLAAHPATNILVCDDGLQHLALARDKTRILHSPEVSMDGDSAALLELAGILQSLELDWEYELSRWLGPLATQVLGSSLRDASRWSAQSLHSLRLNLADYLAEESRTLVGQHEAEARFAELDQLKLALDRLDARVGRLSQKTKPDA